MNELSFIIFLQQFRNPIFDGFAFLFSLIFSFPVILAALFASLFISKTRRYLFYIFSFIPLVLIVKLLKLLFHRARPPLSLIEESTYSFPSGHATFAFFLAYYLSKDYPKKKPLIYLLAFLVALSRVYLGVHYLSDVFAGALLGLFYAFFFEKLEPYFYRLLEKLNKYDLLKEVK